MSVGVGVLVGVRVAVGVNVGVSVGVATTITMRGTEIVGTGVGVGLICKEHALSRSKNANKNFFMRNGSTRAGAQGAVPELDWSRARSKKLLRGDQTAN